MTSAKLRYKIVQVIAPRLYAEWKYLWNACYATPRPMISFLKYRQRDNPLVGAEIGVALGLNAESILTTLLMRKLYLIDPYFNEDERAEAQKRLKGFSQAVWIRKKSEDAVNDVEEHLDFVYIDGNHDYEYVKKDIALYYPLVKYGGVFGGHDYGPWMGVTRAVDEFRTTHSNVQIQFPDWWIVKP